jgi:DNA-binding NarL/FixJ family response regulator
MAGDEIAFVEAAYRLDGSVTEWMGRLLSRLRALVGADVAGAGTPYAALTVAERHVFDLLRLARTRDEIASSRGTSKKTVSLQTSSVYRKLGVQSQAELIAKFGRRDGAGEGAA